MVEIDMPITGQVAEVLDKYRLVINRGQTSGVEVGMIFAVMGFGGDILDPETKESLGPKPIEKLRLKVTDVYEKFSVAETFRVVTPPRQLGTFLSHERLTQNWPGGIHTTLAGPAMPPVPERQRVAGAPEPGDVAPTTAAVQVKLGDSVREVRR